VSIAPVILISITSDPRDAIEYFRILRSVFCYVEEERERERDVSLRDNAASVGERDDHTG
jgi:hypothetical protein